MRIAQSVPSWAAGDHCYGIQIHEEEDEELSHSRPGWLHPVWDPTTRQG
jgi:hypothetical protein